MMKLVYLLPLYLGAVSIQAQEWIDLSVPQPAIVGTPVAKAGQGLLTTDFSLSYDKNSVTDTRESTESMQHYQDGFRRFAESYFTGSKVYLQFVTGNQLCIKTVSQETIDKLEPGIKYVYEGLTAKTVTLGLCSKKEHRNDLVKIIGDMTQALGSGKITQLPASSVDTLSRSTEDSVFYHLILKEPNVYTKVKVIRLKQNGNICNCNWETNCFSYFVNYKAGGFPSEDTLIAGNETRYASPVANPVFCGKENKDIAYQLQVVRDDTGLHLWLCSSEGSKNGAMSRKLEVPFKDVFIKTKMVRQWNLEKTFLYRVVVNEMIKTIFVEISAKQITNDKLVILNWKEGKPGYSNVKLSTLKYPEFKGVFVTK